MKEKILTVAFGFFAACLIVAAIAFNIEKIMMSLIFFAAALVFGVIMVGLNKLVVDGEKSRNN